MCIRDSDNCENLDQFGRQCKDTVQQWVGMPVCVGIAPTKTLAKIAQYGAKKYPGTAGVVDLSDQHRQKRLMALVPVGEVWGVGRKINQKLAAMGVVTALQLSEIGH